MIRKKFNFSLVRLTFLLWAGISTASGISCTKDTAAPQTTTEAPTGTGGAAVRLVSSTLIGEYSTSQLAGRVSEIPIAGALVRYPIRVYKLTYTTHNNTGQNITASGALLVPVTNQPLPLLSYQHGTIRPDDEDRAPSYYSQSSEVYSAVSVLASTGYIVSAPDYVGYGASKALPHPYEHAASLASASLDMLRAAREFAAKEKLALNQKNFLLGYSEGGYATMALHKMIEEKAASEFTVTASAPGAGAYHKSAFADYILQSDQPLNFLSTYVWVLDTYNRMYGLNRPISYYVNEPWATQLQTNLYGEVPAQAKTLFTPTFRQGILDKTDQQMLNAFRDNDIYDWQPKAPVALFHGTADDYVPFFNSQNAYNAMKARGAANVQLRPIQGGNHFSSAASYTLQAYAFISQYY
ncbi:alpha/beta hydrolase family protein [Hymenobacter metallicola]|uniref:alpha/beta hydrolase family protein n=1 Tax=Hymenobacter metallicola TaxID=2563114 RepID=UPI001F0FC4E1|nr:alpha/beta fold hydrolase [Hymenobacter metallicola]